MDLLLSYNVYTTTCVRSEMIRKCSPDFTANSTPFSGISCREIFLQIYSFKKLGSKKFNEGVFSSMYLLYSDCSSGDVLQLGNGIPYLHNGSSFRPICNHCFHNTEYGANLFCQKVGYASGSFIKPEIKVYEDPAVVGLCQETDRDLMSCSGRKCGPCTAVSGDVKKIECSGAFEKRVRFSCPRKGNLTLDIIFLIGYIRKCSKCQ